MNMLCFPLYCIIIFTFYIGSLQCFFLTRDNCQSSYTHSTLVKEGSSIIFVYNWKTNLQQVSWTCLWRSQMSSYCTRCWTPGYIIVASSARWDFCSLWGWGCRFYLLTPCVLSDLLLQNLWRNNIHLKVLKAFWLKRHRWTKEMVKDQQSIGAWQQTRAGILDSSR